VNAFIKQSTSPPNESATCGFPDPLALERQFEIANGKEHLHAALRLALHLLFAEQKSRDIASLRKKAKHQTRVALVCLRISEVVPLSKKIHYMGRATYYARQAARTADSLDLASKTSPALEQWETLFHSSKTRRLTNGCLEGPSERLKEMQLAEKSIQKCIALAIELSNAHSAKAFAEYADQLTLRGDHRKAHRNAISALAKAQAFRKKLTKENEGEKVYIWDIWIAKLKRNYDL
jgi:hypothetical protein